MKKWVGISVLVVLAITAVSAGGYYTWLHTSPPLPATTEDAMSLVKSPRFRRLSEAEREPYVERIRELTDAMTPEQREKSWEMMRGDPELRKEVQKVQVEAMGMRFREFAKADPQRRLAILDEDIQKMEAMRAGGAMMGRRGPGGSENSNNGAGAARPPRPEGENRRPQSNGSSSGQGQPGSANRRDERKKMFHNRIQTGDPQDQAYMGEYFKALMERRRELGLPDRPSHRPSGGGGQRGK